MTGYARTLIPLFANPESNPHGKRLILLTKSANTHFLEGLPTANVSVTFSLNCQAAADVFEGRYPDGLRITPSIEQRVEASRVAEAFGFDTRWRIDPVIPIDNWQQHYRDFFAMAFSKCSPKRVTLGLYREMGKGLRAFSEMWGLPQMQWRPTMDLVQDGGPHYQLPRPMRIEIYACLGQCVQETWPKGRPLPSVALCKERLAVREGSSVTCRNCNCG